MTTSARSPISPASGPESTPLLYSVLRVLAFVILISMLVSIVYSGWITLENWNAIGV